MKNYYIPHTKQGLILSLVVMKVKILSRLKAMDKKQLYAIYFAVMDKQGKAVTKI